MATLEEMLIDAGDIAHLDADRVRVQVEAEFDKFWDDVVTQGMVASLAKKDPEALTRLRALVKAAISFGGSRGAVFSTMAVMQRVVQIMTSPPPEQGNGIKGPIQ